MIEAKARSNCTYNTAGKAKPRTIQFYIHPKPHPPALPVHEVLWRDYEGHFWWRYWIETFDLCWNLDIRGFLHEVRKIGLFLKVTSCLHFDQPLSVFLSRWVGGVGVKCWLTLSMGGKCIKQGMSQITPVVNMQGFIMFSAERQLVFKGGQNHFEWTFFIKKKINSPAFPNLRLLLVFRWIWGIFGIVPISSFSEDHLHAYAYGKFVHHAN